MQGSPSSDAKFRHLYDPNLPTIRSYCLRRLPTSEVNDAVAEVFLVAWRRIDDAPDGGDGIAWLYGIAHNIVRNSNRSLRRRNRLANRVRRSLDHIESGPEPLVVRRSEDKEILEALARLRPADREILQLSVWEELTNVEIAEVLGIDQHAVAMRLSRARNRMAKILGLTDHIAGSRTDTDPIMKGVDREN